MSGFSAEWLALREPADTAARAPQVTDAVATALAGRTPLRVADLGCGTGSNMRYLASRLPQPQVWRLLDHDAALLATARTLVPQAVDTRVADLRDLDAAAFEGCDLVTASALLEQIGIPASGHMVAVMALMESPAIIAAIVLARRAGVSSGNTESHGTAGLLREALFNGSVLLLLGSLAIGMITGARGAKALYPFTSDIFQGFLSLFLLEMGISSARRFKDLRIFGIRPLVVAVGIPLVNATLGISLAWLGGLSRGDALIFTVLCASASYIAVPAVMRMSLPESNPGLFVPMALAITFPFNVAIGIPLYLGIIERLWR